MGARTGFLDDYDVCELSLCSPCALFLSLLSSYLEDLSLTGRAPIMFVSRYVITTRGWQVQDASIPHGGSSDPFHESPRYRGE